MKCVGKIFVRANLKYISIFSGVLFLWMLGWYLVVTAINDSDAWTHRGQFGDMFGAINSLFSGLAFAGIIVTILLQKEELRLQRKELKLTRKELKLTRNEFKDQNDSLWLQGFETTFFNLLSLHNSIVEGATQTVKSFINVPSIMTTGRAYFDAINGQLKIALEDKCVTEDNLRGLSNAYSDGVDSYRTAIYLFLESAYRIVKFVFESELVTGDEKKFYYSILETSLSQSEKTIIYYHLCFTDDSDPVKVKIIELDQLCFFFSNLKPQLFHTSHFKLKDMSWRKVKAG